jgi:hypothetical protein
MTRAGLLGIAMLCCLEFVVTAQVNNTEPPSKPPSYTPEQLFGRSPSPRGSSTTNSDSTRESTSDSSRESSTPAQPLPSPSRATTPQPPTPSPACASPTNTPPPNASAYPGVSASQFQRAGVGADAFERAGVSADQLRTLIPGNHTNTCAKQRDVVLHPPDPERPPSPLRLLPDQQ